MLEAGLPILRRPRGVAECQDARQVLLLRAKDPHVRLWLDQIVPVDVRRRSLELVASWSACLSDSSQMVNSPPF